MPSLFTRHSMLLQTAFSEIKRQAGEQAEVLIGTPGSVSTREVNGGLFYYRQFYDAEGRKRAQYIGALHNPDAARRAEALRGQIAVSGALARQGRELAERGYVRADTKTAAVVAAFSNHGIFRAGATLIGSHAFGALLNELGVRAAAFTTEDVDLARDAPLSPEALPGGKVEIVRVLETSTVPLFPVPSLDRKAPSTSFKGRGRSGLRVDLVVPSRGNEITTKAVPELAAHATALPHLRALLVDPLETVLLAREGVIPIRVPRPAAFAWHKMQLASLRSGSDKHRKDTHQASVIFAVLAEDAPDALASELDTLSASTRRRVATGATAVARALDGTPHTRAQELLSDLVRSSRLR